jgi:hypothetical protein
MTDERPPYSRSSAELPDEAPMTLDEIVDRAGRRVATALILAGAFVGLAIYWQPAPARYQVAASGNQVLRIDTRKGTIIACEAGKCATVLKHGQHLVRELTLDAVPRPAAPPALPAPAAAPAPSPPAAPAGR